MNKKYLKEEQQFRSLTQKAIRLWFKNKQEPMTEDLRFRHLVRQLILEVATEDPGADPHEYTGINYLRRLFKNTNVVTTLKSAFVSLTTDPTQRESFRAHIINWVVDTLSSVKANDLAPANLNKYEDFKKIRKKTMNIQEKVDVDFIDVEDDAAQGESEKELKAAQERQKEKAADLRNLPNQDTTGRNAAVAAYNDIETSVVGYYSQLSNEDDQEIFADWLVTNLKMYFDKWEKELAGQVEEPTNSEYEEQAQQASEEAEAPPAEAEAPEGEIPPEGGPPEEAPPGPPGPPGPEGAPPGGGVEDFEAELRKLAGG